MSQGLVLLVLLFALGANGVQFPVMDVTQLAEFWGYPVENYWITTPDDYILNLQRLPNPDAGNKTIFLQHGLFGSSARFLVGPPHQSLAYILHDLGYDVWLGNTRGNTYSRNHTTLDPDSNKRAFWNFDWDIAGMGDLPASIELVKQVTGQDQLFYLGHSMGTTEFLVVASELPEFQDNFYAAFLMAPPSWMAGHTDDILAQLSNDWKALETTFELLGIWEVLPDNNATTDIGHNQCDEINYPSHEESCLDYADKFLMVSHDQLNITMLPIYFDVFPEGSSVKPLVHYGQSINNTGYFRKYDMGSETANMNEYGTPVPPDYRVDLITMPIYLFYGDGDTLVMVDDVIRLSEELPNCQLVYQVPKANWTHNDFVYAMDAPTLLYDVIIDNMNDILS